MTIDKPNGVENKDKSGIIYVLSNSYMPGLIKIGKTASLKSRLDQLYNTSVPAPFTCEGAFQVHDMDEVESRLHFAFQDVRVNPKREFFKVDASRPIAILEYIGKDITPEVEKAIEEGISDEELKSKKRRPVMRFADLQIPVGAELEFTRDKKIVATVVDADSTVKCGSDVMILSPMTARLLGKEGAPIRGTDYWTYNGKSLRDMYETLYPF
jgi:hypothetical protein